MNGSVSRSTGPQNGLRWPIGPARGTTRHSRCPRQLSPGQISWKMAERRPLHCILTEHRRGSLGMKGATADCFTVGAAGLSGQVKGVNGASHMKITFDQKYISGITQHTWMLDDTKN